MSVRPGRKYHAKVCATLSDFENLASAIDNAAHLLRFEITESSNIHLYATVDGRQRRRVITPKNASHQSLLSAAKSQLSEDEQKKIIELYFK